MSVCVSVCESVSVSVSMSEREKWRGCVRERVCVGVFVCVREREWSRCGVRAVVRKN